MLIKIDENKIKPEEVFNANGLRVLRYSKPMFIQITEKGTINTVTATRVIKQDGTKHSYKTPYLYRMIFENSLVEKIDKLCKMKHAIPEWDNYIRNNSYYDPIPCWRERDLMKILMQSIYELTGYLGDYITSYRYDVRFEYNINKDISQSYLSVVFYDTNAFTEIVGMSSKEKALEDMKNDRAMFNSLFTNNIIELCKANGFSYSPYSGDVYFYPNEYEELKEIIRDYVNKKILDKLKAMGIKIKDRELDIFNSSVCIATIEQSVKGIVK